MTGTDPIDQESLVRQGHPVALHASAVPFVGGPADGWTVMLIKTTRPDLMTVHPQLPDFVEVGVNEDGPRYTVWALWPDTTATVLRPSRPGTHLYALCRNTDALFEPDRLSYQHVETVPTTPDQGGTQ